MSIIVYSGTEMVELFHVYVNLSKGRFFGPQQQEIGKALVAAHLANVSASMISYGLNVGGYSIEPVDQMLEYTPVKLVPITPRVKKEWVNKVRNLMSNCWSNGGSNFLPDEYAAVLRAAVYCILDGLAGMNTDD